ncbi:hypothetical protein GCM10011400_26230 [Paraburkholderia caffeinilytica]|uniref:Secreted protein n=1 Tax=Paraburkholderia caffeinilytica TaxID=1761016 RepID=A0ABQ1MC33_9BURK|nr:hypothetical protein GCM10011400_26230 [Paraburkholderia caffeinilytica]
MPAVLRVCWLSATRVKPYARRKTMYIAVLVPTLQQMHIHSDAALALHSVKPHWLVVSWHRVKALLPNPAS